MSAEMIMILLVLGVLLPAMGVFLAVTPQLMNKRECFTVTVPEAAAADPEIKRIKKRYMVSMLAATVVLTAFALILFALAGAEGTSIALTIGVCLLLALSFGLMLRARRQVQHVKEARGWHAKSEMHAAVVAEGEVPHPISLGWETLNLAVALLTLAIGIVGYQAMPAQVPLHVDFSGQVTNWVDKGPAVVLFPVLTQLFLTACLTMAHWSISRSKRPVDSDAPISTAFAYGLFARAQSIYLVALGVLLNLAFISLPFMMIGLLSIGQATFIILLVALAAIVGSLAMSVVYGQNGSRVMRRFQDPDFLPADDDEYWKLGVFYVNRDDPSLFVPKRFGIGWTSNFGRPATWFIIGGFVLVVIAFMVAMLLMFP